jgi:hypothetical protein
LAEEEQKIQMAPILSLLQRHQQAAVVEQEMNPELVAARAEELEELMATRPSMRVVLAHQDKVQQAVQEKAQQREAQEAVVEENPALVETP